MHPYQGSSCKLRWKGVATSPVLAPLKNTGMTANPCSPPKHLFLPLCPFLSHTGEDKRVKCHGVKGMKEEVDPVQSAGQSELYTFLWPFGCL